MAPADPTFLLVTSGCQGHGLIDFRFSLGKEWEQDSVGGIMVSIAAFQAVDPGSIPGRRINFSLSLSPVTTGKIG